MDSLPIELVQHIALQLSSLSDLANLSQCGSRYSHLTSVDGVKRYLLCQLGIEDTVRYVMNRIHLSSQWSSILGLMLERQPQLLKLEEIGTSTLDIVLRIKPFRLSLLNQAEIEKRIHIIGHSLIKVVEVLWRENDHYGDNRVRYILHPVIKYAFQVNDVNIVQWLSKQQLLNSQILNGISADWIIQLIQKNMNMSELVRVLFDNGITLNALQARTAFTFCMQNPVHRAHLLDIIDQIKHHRVEELEEEVFKSAWTVAVYHNNIQACRVFLEEPMLRRFIDWNVAWTMVQAKGFVELLEWLMTNKAACASMDMSWLIYRLVQENHVEAVRWVKYQSGIAIPESCWVKCIQEAKSHGKFEMLYVLVDIVRHL